MGRQDNKIQSAGDWMNIDNAEDVDLNKRSKTEITVLFLAVGISIFHIWINALRQLADPVS